MAILQHVALMYFQSTSDQEITYFLAVDQEKTKSIKLLE